tara:strand:- start:1654 stop:1890 length:237 start_codon:yes stop_codon:yes gene_type:complete
LYLKKKRPKKESKKNVKKQLENFHLKILSRKNLENAASSRRGRVRARETPERTQTANDDDDKDDDDDNITTEERKKCE